MKKHTLMATLLAIPTLCPAVVIGDFEGANNLDGWAPTDEQRSNVAVSTVGLGATAGAQALRVVNTSISNSWGYITGDTDTLALLVAPGSMVTADVRARGWQIAGPSLSLRLLVSRHNGGDSISEQTAIQQVIVNNTSQTMTFELTDTARAILANSSSSASIDFTDVSTNTRTWYVDNIQAINPSYNPTSLYADWLSNYPTVANESLGHSIRWTGARDRIAAASLTRSLQIQRNR